MEVASPGSRAKMRAKEGENRKEFPCEFQKRLRIYKRGCELLQ
jgi:hypothetical protein